VNIFIAGIRWVLDPAHYGGINGIDTRTVQHLVITLVSLATSAAIAIPLGYLVGHTGRGRALAVAVSGGVRALPTLGFLILIALGVGVGFEAPYVALVVLGIPSILAGAYSGFEAIDRRTIDAARAVGMTEWQIVGKVEIPLGLPLLMGGLRLAALQIVATATLADYVGAGGLGHLIFLGLQTSDYPQMLAGSLVVIVLAIISEILFSILQKLVVPAGVAGGRLNDVRVRSSRSRAALG
jgi:osmoprotectant transport system permease protein